MKDVLQYAPSKTRRRKAEEKKSTICDVTARFSSIVAAPGISQAAQIRETVAQCCPPSRCPSNVKGLVGKLALLRHGFFGGDRQKASSPVHHVLLAAAAASLSFLTQCEHSATPPRSPMNVFSSSCVCNGVRCARLLVHLTVASLPGSGRLSPRSCACVRLLAHTYTSSHALTLIVPRLYRLLRTRHSRISAHASLIMLICCKENAQ